MLDAQTRRLELRVGEWGVAAAPVSTKLGDNKHTPWEVTAGANFGGMTCDGLDGADWGGKEHGFHAFAMGTFQGPAWLMPVARYYAGYARDIGRYALNAANSPRLF